MEWSADLHEINRFYSVQRDEALARLRASGSKHARHPPEDLHWTWTLAVEISPVSSFSALMGQALPGVASKPPQEAPDDAARLSHLQSVCDRKLRTTHCLRLACEHRYCSERVTHRAPQSFLDRESPPLPPTHVPAQVIYVYRTGNAVLQEGVYPEEVLGAFRDQSGTVQVVTQSHTRSILHLDASTRQVFYAGGLRPKAFEAMQAAAAGGTFRYRNAPFVRLSEAQIGHLLAATPIWSHGGLWESSIGLALSGGASGAQATADTPVFALGATHDERLRTPVGTVSSLGLLPA